MVIVRVMKAVSEKNDEAAAAIRSLLAEKHINSVNIISSPGSGKTALLEKTFKMLPFDIMCAVIVGDPFGTSDAERLEAAGGSAVQLNTEGSCHLTAPMIAAAMEDLKLDGLALLFIENIGNLICPAAWDLGETARVTLLSVTEGTDKVMKYRKAFYGADAIVLSKVDLAEMSDFDIDRARVDIASLNPHARIIELSSKSGAGMEDWISWLQELLAT
jgi:hydrogenase nickel incorporation protein HypB